VVATTPGARILDGRTQEELATDHLAKAVLIPWADQKSSPVRRKNSIRASRCWFTAAALFNHGFADVRNLEGGIFAWEKAG